MTFTWGCVPGWFIYQIRGGETLSPLAEHLLDWRVVRLLDWKAGSPSRIWMVANLLWGLQFEHVPWNLQESIENPFLFWSQIAEEFHWHERPTEENFIKYNFNINEGPIFIEWLKDAKLNICYNALDRHIEKRGNQVDDLLRLPQPNEMYFQFSYPMVFADCIFLGRKWSRKWGENYLRRASGRSLQVRQRTSRKRGEKGKENECSSLDWASGNVHRYQILHSWHFSGNHQYLFDKSRWPFQWIKNIANRQICCDICIQDNQVTNKIFWYLQGDRVAIYMPMILELVVAMLACARIGAIHSIVFGGYR